MFGNDISLSGCRGRLPIEVRLPINPMRSQKVWWEAMTAGLTTFGYGLGVLSTSRIGPLSVSNESVLSDWSKLTSHLRCTGKWCARTDNENRRGFTWRICSKPISRPRETNPPRCQGPVLVDSLLESVPGSFRKSTCSFCRRVNRNATAASPCRSARQILRRGSSFLILDLQIIHDLLHVGHVGGQLFGIVARILRVHVSSQGDYGTPLPVQKNDYHGNRWV